MYKKFLILLILFIFLLPSIVLGDDIDNETVDLSSIETLSETSSLPIINSKHAIVLEKNTNTVLYEKDAYSKTPMASTTKIMTAIIALENCNLKDEIHISSKAAHTGGSTLGITTNSTLTMETLLYGLLLRSGNDCAVAIAEHISGDIPNFAILMNNKAKELNLQNTNFVTPHGLDADSHYTTAYDLAILAKYALTNETFSKIVNTKNTTIQMENYSKDIHNTHELLGYTDGVYGVKTGFTGNAGRCLVTACKRQNLDIIIVVLGADTKKIRTTDTLNLINYAYNNFEMVDTSEILKSQFNNITYTPKIQRSFILPEIKLEEKANYTFPVNKNSKDFSVSCYLLNNLKAPLAENSKIGVIKFNTNGSTLYENNILIKNSISSISTSEYFFHFLKNWQKYFNIYE